MESPVAEGSRSGLEPREAILDAAACLFAQRGVAAPRDIAAVAGVREALIRFHFPAGKDELLAELLLRLFRARLDTVEWLEDLRAQTGVAPDAVLYALVVLDMRILTRAPHNEGVLSRLAEARNKDICAPFRNTKDELEAAYARLGGQVADTADPAERPALPAEFLGSMLLHQAEVVIGMRSEGRRITPAIEAEVAAGCLRLCLVVDQARIDEAAARAADLIERGSVVG